MWLADLFGFQFFGDGKSPLPIDVALQLSALLICLDVISQDIAKVALQLRRRLPNGGSEVVQPSEHHIAKYLNGVPSKWHSWFEMKQMMILHFGIVQNAFLIKGTDSRGRINSLIPWMPGLTSILINEETGDMFYDFDRKTPVQKAMLKSDERFFHESEVIHFRGRLFDGLNGYSTLQAGAGVMQLAKAIQEYQTRLYQNDAVIRGVFQMKNEQALSEEAFRRLKAQLVELWQQAREKGKPIVLEEGMEFKSISMESDAAETAKAKDKSIEDMARLFRIPPHKMMHIVNVKYENMETLEKSYVQDSLIPIAVNVEEKLDNGMLTEDEKEEMFLQFDREAMVLTDVEKQAMIMKVLANNAAITIDEMRAHRGMNPLPNGAGEVRLVPANYFLVDENNEIVLEPQQQEETSPDPEDNDTGQKSTPLSEVSVN